MQYAIFQRFLGSDLRSGDLVVRRAALVRWLKAVLAWQAAELVIAFAWILPNVLNHTRDLLWLLPVVGLLVGTALPLQLVVIRISRRVRP